jgi:outer membrane protein TolC
MRSPSLATLPAATLLPLALLSACAAVPKLGPAPQIAAPAQFDARQTFGADATATAWPGADWWTGYGDAQLDGLIAEALAGSPDLAAAAARVREADAYAEQANAARLPTLDATGSSPRTSASTSICGGATAPPMPPRARRRPRRGSIMRNRR